MGILLGSLPGARCCVLGVDELTGAEAEAMAAITADDLVGVLRLADAVDIAGTALGAEVSAVLLIKHDELHRRLVLNCGLVELRLFDTLLHGSAVGEDDVTIEVLDNLVSHSD